MVNLTRDGSPLAARAASGDQLRAFKADLFKALAHPARVKILELLRGEARTVSELQAELGIEPSSVSQQLAVLRAKHIVDGRREGTSVYYTVRDPQVFVLLDAARQIFNNHLIDLQAMADEEIAVTGDAG
jgi:ArsR family transcriptional regulator